MAKEYRVGPVIRIVNRLMSRAIGKGRMQENMYLLTTLGRKSGLERTTPVALAVRDGRRYIVSPYGNVGWVYNIRESGLAELKRGGAVEEIAVTEIDDPAIAGAVLKQYVGENFKVKPFFNASKSDPVEAFAAEASQHPVFRIDS